MMNEATRNSAKINIQVQCQNKESGIDEKCSSQKLSHTSENWSENIVHHWPS